MLKQEFGPYLDRLAAGLVGDGSECFGLDDSISRDHDWGPGFCLWLARQDYEDIAKRLQASLDGLPKTFEGCGPRRTSEWGDGRVGVFEVSGFYQRFLSLDRIPKDLDTWMVLPGNSLAACTNGKVFRDPLGEFTEWRDALQAFYPEDVRRKKIAARCMTIGQAGQYNFPRCVQRGELFAARYAETKFCADVISVVFLLNRRYTPFYKWMHRALGDLPLARAAAPVRVRPGADAGHVSHLFPVRSADRDRLQAHLASRGIETLVHYPVPVPRQPALGAARPAECPVCDRACAELISLPLHPALPPAAIDEVARAVGDFPTRR